MSVQAHRIIGIKVEESYTSFNLRHDDKLVEYLDKEVGFYSQLTADGTGIAFVHLNVLEKAVEKASELGLDEDTVKHLRADIEWAKSQDEETVDYWCY